MTARGPPEALGVEIWCVCFEVRTFARRPSPHPDGQDLDNGRFPTSFDLLKVSTSYAGIAGIAGRGGIATGGSGSVGSAGSVDRGPGRVARGRSASSSSPTRRHRVDCKGLRSRSQGPCVVGPDFQSHSSGPRVGCPGLRSWLPGSWVGCLDLRSWLPGSRVGCLDFRSRSLGPCVGCTDLGNCSPGPCIG